MHGMGEWHQLGGGQASHRRRRGEKCCLSRRMLLSSPKHPTALWSASGAWERCYSSSQDRVGRKQSCTMGMSQDGPIRGRCSLGTEHEHKPLLLCCRGFFQICHSGARVAEEVSFVCRCRKGQEGGEGWFALCLCVDM